MPTAKQQRYMRLYQANRRGSRSYKSEAENLRIMLAVEAGELTQSAGAKALGTDIVTLRELIQAAAAIGVSTAAALIDGK